MQTRDIVFKELKQRRFRLLTGFLAILLAMALIVCIRSISHSSQEAVRKQLRNLGANMFVIPQSLALSNFYSADYGNATFLETYFYRLKGEGFEEIESIEGRLSRRINIGNQKVILTGIMADGKPQEATFSFTFTPGEVLLGNEIANELNLKEGTALRIKGKEFIIGKILSQRGNIDDITIFAPLSAVQGLLGEQKVINQIEIISTRTEGQERLSEEIEALLPGTKVITKGRFLQAQANTISALNKYSLILLIIVLFIGGVSIANYTSINVRERRREIGTLLALGATPSFILKIFLQKAVMLGLVGGSGGYMFGAVLAILLGPKIIQAPIRVSGLWLIWSIIAATVFSLIFSALPSIRASQLDPARILQEE